MGNVAHFQLHEVTTSKLTIDGQIEQCQISRFLFELQVYADRPDLLGLERWFLTHQFAFVPRYL